MGTFRSQDWQGNVHNNKERLDYLHRNHIFTDVTFVVGHEKSQRISAHKLVLSMCSQVFSAMFYGALAENSQKEIVVPDVEPEEWKTLLRFMYTDEINLTSTENAIKTAYAAKKYMLNDLYDQCMTYLNNNMNFSTVCQIHEAAYFLDNQQLERDSLHMIIQKTQKVLEASSATTLTHFILKKLIKQQFLPTLKESTLFGKIIEWINETMNEDNANRRTILDEFLPSIRFLTMDTNDFVSACAKTRLLTDTEIVSIACNLAVSASRPLPTWCSHETKSRIGHKPTRCTLQCAGDATFRESETAKVKGRFQASQGNFVLHGVDFNRLLRPAKVTDTLEMEVQYRNEKTDRTSIFATSCCGDEYCKFPSPELLMQGDICSIEIVLQNPPKFYGRADIYKDDLINIGDIIIKLLNDENEEENEEKCCKPTGLIISQLE